MGTIRYRKRSNAAAISPLAVDAYKVGDWLALYKELRLPPWLFGPALLNLDDGWLRREHIRDALREAAQ
ncbi:hypothetical protein [Dokdonella immobilis]|uniref:Uncharacterized protein n=1 Tax=Dokdonella immobilis TaxID=578942 RepID=A0A1I4ZU01_9GAMM|nr:hypothetical protein [Dokdonella immobilis]SFN53756.1 hypothetical protein SAMN05216289_1296 [Dokdonella immobilis]